MLLLDILSTIIIVSLFCNGLFLITKKENKLILAFLDRWIDYFLNKRRESLRNKLKKTLSDLEYKKFMIDGKEDKYVYRWIWLINPVFGCITCMSSVWGFLICWHFHPAINLIELTIIIICSAFLNNLLYGFTKKI